MKYQRPHDIEVVENGPTLNQITWRSLPLTEIQGNGDGISDLGEKIKSQISSKFRYSPCQSYHHKEPCHSSDNSSREMLKKWTCIHCSVVGCEIEGVAKGCEVGGVTAAVMSLTITVPEVVPSLFHNSIPLVPSSARK